MSNHPEGESDIALGSLFASWFVCAMRFKKFSSGVAVLAAVLSASAANAATPMTFRLVSFGGPQSCKGRCPEVISAEGEITNETPRRYLEFVARNLDDERVRSVVFLHSPGGGVAASMRLGEMFRKTGVLAIVARLVPTEGGGSLALPIGRCFSACVYALMGAKKRVVPPTSFVGIHRMFFTNYGRDLATGSDEPQQQFGSAKFVGQLSDYASAMGVSRELVMRAERINPNDIHIVTPQELKRWHLATQSFK